MPIYDFVCESCNKTEEKITSMLTESVACSCGGIMWRQISAPNFHLDGTDPDFPGAYAKWGRTRVRQAEKHKKKSYYEG